MKPLALLTAAVIGVSATIALAQEGPTSQQKARQGMMNIIVLNLGVLGRMAKGEVEFDAVEAQAAADTLVTVSQISQRNLWPEGSDNDASFTTEALAEIWEKPDEFRARWEDFGIAALGLQNAVAGGQAALGPAMGAAGKACGACHKPFRQATN